MTVKSTSIQLLCAATSTAKNICHFSACIASLLLCFTLPAIRGAKRGAEGTPVSHKIRPILKIHFKLKLVIRIVIFDNAAL